MPDGKCTRARRYALLSAVLAAASPLAEAQQRLEEIIVTAQRRAENVQDVPIAVTVVPGDTLDRRSITQGAQIADFSPNLHIEPTLPFSGSNSVLAGYLCGL